MTETVDSNTQTIQNEFQISRVAFRPPPLWKEEIELWFFQLESSFEVAGISVDCTKFHCLVSVLDAEVLGCVRGLLKRTEPKATYEDLKKQILAYFAQSESSKLRKLLQDLQLGDRRPSKLLADMRVLAGTSMSDEVIQTLWLQRLPAQVQQILSVSKEPLDDLARLADKVCEVSNLTCVSEVANVERTSDMQDLQQQICELQKSIERISRPQRRSGNRARNRSGSRSRNRQQNFRTCWYHYKFGSKARDCIPPCMFFDQNKFSSAKQEN